MKTRIEVDTNAVKKANEEANDWCGVCRVCHKELCGTLNELREHVNSHVTESKSKS